MKYALLPLLFLCLAASAFAGEEDWPQFRGPTGQGNTDAKNLPTTWSETKNVKWKTPIHGKGWSSPVIWGKQIWLTSATEDGHDLFIICIDKETGKIIHDQRLFEDIAANPVFKQYNSYASPTPVIEEGRIYISFGAAGTACLDTATFKTIWERRDIKVNHYRGAGSSPLIYNDLLIQDYDGSDAQFVICLNKKTGDTLWKTPRSHNYGDVGPDGKIKADGDFRKAFSTCRIAIVNGSPAAISISSKATYAYEPNTGKEIWRLEHPGWHSAGSSPVIGDGLIFICPGFGKSAIMAVRANGTGVLPPENIAFTISKNAPDKQSLVLADGLIYFIDGTGFASCADAQSGKEMWRQRLVPNFSAAPILGDGKVYFCGDDGTTSVVAAGREFKKLAANKLDAAFHASPAVSGKALFLRTDKSLYRIEE